MISIRLPCRVMTVTILEYSLHISRRLAQAHYSPLAFLNRTKVLFLYYNNDLEAAFVALKPPQQVICPRQGLPNEHQPTVGTLPLLQRRSVLLRRGMTPL